MPEPEYKPRDHQKQKIVAKLHSDIYEAQNEYDRKMEEINEIGFKTKTLQEDIDFKMSQAEDLQRSREDQVQKAKQCELQLIPLTRERDDLNEQIAKNEE